VDLNDGKIGCQLCGARVHIMQAHLKDAHPDVSLATYQANFPGADILSDKARVAMAKLEEQKKAGGAASAAAAAGSVEEYAGGFTASKVALHEVFELGDARAARGHTGKPIPVNQVVAPDFLSQFVPAKDDNYIFPIDLLKEVMLAMEMNLPVYLWGHAGTGKTTIAEQVCARTGRPILRVQHTRNTEESHVVGQWTVRDGHTVFELGPLAYCMKHGVTYLADEYDFAMPAVTALYQPVLEGKSLVIKEADHENRVITPHPMFRFVATGNTNGTGDETGLYQGTLMQNAANYERFAIVEEVKYMDPETEVGVIVGQGGVPKDEAQKLVQFGRLVREGFANGKIGLPVSPRALINAAKTGRRLASFERGLMLAYVNRLARADQEVAREIMGRIKF
jgi:cobaltochelatase CobS